MDIKVAPALREQRAFRFATYVCSYREKYDAMSPVEKEAARWQSMKRNGLFLTFVNLKPSKRRRT
jgi:hypothetical protein